MKMELKLDSEKVSYFERAIGEVAPWYHRFKFSDNILTGYYKVLGLGDEVTWVNSHSDQSRIEKMLDAYRAIDHSTWVRFLEQIFDNLEIADRKKACLLDLAASSGRNSIIAVNSGFGHVISADSYPNYCDQQNLLYECLEDRQYAEKIEVVSSRQSPDSDEYPSSFEGHDIDVVFSSRILHHVSDPVQHLINLREITRRYAVIYTKTHQLPDMEGYWELRTKDEGWMASSGDSIGWKPHFQEVPVLCRRLGFSRVTTLYPDVFERNFPVEHYSVQKYRWQTFLNHLGINTGYYKNKFFTYYRQFGISPNYYAYILEK